MSKPIIALSLSPLAVSLADRPFSLFVDPATGSVFVDEGPGEGRVNGLVFSAANGPVFEVRGAADAGWELVLRYRGLEYVAGTTADEQHLRTWADGANAVVVGKHSTGPAGTTGPVGPSTAAVKGAAAAAVAKLFVTSLPTTFPTRFGPFRLDRKLGSGGMGVVYDAFDEVDERQVALKVTRPERSADPAVRDRFRREARIVAKLDPVRSTSICRLYRSGEHDGVPFYTMEFIPGTSLDQYWKDHGTALGPWGAADLVQRLARIVGLVHDRAGVLHLDLKPQNVMVVPPAWPDPEPELVVVDFGLARTMTGPGAGTGQGVGTPPYMAPEQYGGGRQLTEAADIYALGVILYELVTGEPPFRGNRNELMVKTQTDFAPPPSARNPDLRPFDAICAKALAKARRDRYGTAERFANALNQAYLDAQDGKIAKTRVATRGLSRGPLVHRDTFRLAFVPPGFTAEPADPAAVKDRLLVGVGGATGPGAVDRRTAGTTTTARAVLRTPDFLAQARRPDRLADDLFTLVLPGPPGLDALVSAHLAAEYLAEGKFPTGAEALVKYVERDAAGDTLTTPARPFTLQAAARLLAARPRTDAPPDKRFEAVVFDAVRVIGYVLKQVDAGAELAAVNAFDAPTVFSDADRAAVTDDVRRYYHTLAEPASAARRCRAHLPEPAGGTRAVAALLVRGVERRGDPNRCADFAGWARGDARSAGEAPGFTALAAFEPEGAGRPPRCVVSVAPERGCTLAGLGAELDRLEAEERVRRFRADDRVTDPATGEALPPRPGYPNSDPWDDGRDVGYTTVASPRSGTLLTADQIETEFLKFAAAVEVHSLAASAVGPGS